METTTSTGSAACVVPEAVFHEPGPATPAFGPPRAAVIEILERHQGPRKGFTGTGSLLVPNRMRINGVAVYATYERPAVIQAIEIDGACRKPFSVTVQLQGRALRVGGQPAYEAVAESDGVEHGAVVEIPGVEHLEPGEDVTMPWVLLNGHRLYVEDKIRIGQMATGGPKQDLATVTLTLLCRQLIVDDEPLGEPES